MNSISSIHDAIGWLNSIFKMKPWSEAWVKMKFRYIDHLCEVHSKEAYGIINNHAHDLVMCFMVLGIIFISVVIDKKKYSIFK